MSSHEEEDQDLDREIHVDVDSVDSRGAASDSEIDMEDDDGAASCYDDTDIGISEEKIGPAGQTRTTASETLPFSISRLLSKPFEHSTNHNNNNNNNEEKRAKDQDIFSDSDFGKFTTNLAGIPYTTSGTLYTYPLYPPGHVLRVPPRNGSGGPLQWPLPTLHPAALAHQAVKDRLAGERRRRLIDSIRGEWKSN